jgi:glutaredoxin 3
MNWCTAWRSTRATSSSSSKPPGSVRLTGGRAQSRPSSCERAQPKAAVILVRRDDHSERLPGRPLSEGHVPGVGQRTPQKHADPVQCLRREWDRPRRAGTADRASGARRVGGERAVRPALGAALQVWEIAGEPEQLQLKREGEQVEPGLGRAGRDLVSEVEKARERTEGALVRLLLREQLEHRLRAGERDTEPVGVIPGALVRADQVDPGDRLELAPPLVEEDLNVAEGLEPGAETRSRLPDSLRYGADTAAGERVDVEDAVGLAEAERPQHDGLGGRRPSHEASVEAGLVGKRHGVMARIQVYTTRWCGYCYRAKALLTDKGLEYEEISLDDDPAFRRNLFDATGGWTVPQIVIDGEPVGGYAELWRLDRSGGLDERLAA